MLEVIKNGINQRLHFEIESLFGDEMQIDEERVVLLSHPPHVDDFVEVTAFVLFRNVADFACLQNEKVEVVLERLNDFLGMVDAHFNLFSE